MSEPAKTFLACDGQSVAELIQSQAFDGSSGLFSFGFTVERMNAFTRRARLNAGVRSRQYSGTAVRSRSATFSITVTTPVTTITSSQTYFFAGLNAF
jgi:hypothetical protein